MTYNHIKFIEGYDMISIYAPVYVRPKLHCRMIHLFIMSY